MVSKCTTKTQLGAVNGKLYEGPTLTLRDPNPHYDKVRLSFKLLFRPLIDSLTQSVTYNSKQSQINFYGGALPSASFNMVSPMYSPTSNILTN